jgi:hypothetical protein
MVFGIGSPIASWSCASLLRRIADRDKLALARAATLLSCLFCSGVACHSSEGAEPRPVAKAAVDAAAAAPAPLPVVPASPSSEVAREGTEVKGAASADGDSRLAKGGKRGATDSAEPAPSATEARVASGSLAGRKNVLHVGDSMVGYRMGLQLELGKMFRAAGTRYDAHTFTAAGIHSFASEKHVEKLVRENDPDLVIVQIGTNNLTVPHPEAYLSDLRSIVAQIGGRACFWIGPIPIEKPELGMRGVIRDNVAPCVFFDSYDLDLPRQGDHLHPTQGAAKKWAAAFWEFASSR